VKGKARGAKRRRAPEEGARINANKTLEVN
jgi:hypothetical protein